MCTPLGCHRRNFKLSTSSATSQKTLEALLLFYQFVLTFYPPFKYYIYRQPFIVYSSKMSDFNSEWKTGPEIAKIVQKGDVVEIDLGNGVSHFIFNIRNGWCVHIRTPDVVGLVTEVVKDATDLLQETGPNPCRINNFDDLAAEKELVPRTLKDSLTLARSGLAHGPISVALNDITSVTDPDNIAKEFCIYWKYATPESELQLSSIQIVAIMSFVAVAVASALLLAFL